jgi:hypothetical protein
LLPTTLVFARQTPVKDLSWLLICLLVQSSWSLGQDREPKHDGSTDVGRGAWSGEAISLFNTFGGFGADEKRQASFYSPDHKKQVRIHDQAVAISIEGREYPTDFWVKSSAELGWAPDSSRFFLTWTDGGETGQWHVEVYDVSSGRLRQIKRMEEAPRRDFDNFIRGLPKNAHEPFWASDKYCSPNVVAAQWLNGSSELLVSVLVPNVGDCRYMSEFNVYRLAIPSGKILQRYAAREAREKFNPSNLPLIAK